MGIRKFIIATVLAGIALVPATSFGKDRSYGTIEAYQALYAPEIRSNKATLNMYLSRRTLGADLAADGFNIITGDSYQINNVSVLNATTLGSSVVSSSLTSLGTIASLVATTADINAGTIDGATIGASSASTGAFTTLANTGTMTQSGALVRTIVNLDPDVTTFSVATGTTFYTGSNTTATALTDVTGGVAGQIFTIVTTGGANWTTIADSGNFNIAGSGGFAPDSADDSITFLIQADNDYIQIYGTMTNN